MMKTSIVLLLAAISAAASIERRQGYLDIVNSVGPSGIAAMGSVPKVANTTTLKSEVRSDAIHQIVKLGPINLKGNNNGKEQNSFWRIKDGICKDCTLLKGKVGLVYADGSPAGVNNGIYIHHILAWDLEKKQSSFLSGCDTSTPLAASSSAKFMGTGDDQAGIPVWYSTRDGKIGGYYIGKDDTFPMWLDLVNYNKDNKALYVTIEQEFIKGKTPANTKEILVAVDGCLGASLKVSSAGPTTSTSGKWTFQDDGTIVFAKGHLHGGGVKMTMMIDGKSVCESVATYGSSGKTESGKPAESITNMSICPEPITVKKGQKLSMTAVYDASKHPVHKGSGIGMPDVMGMWSVSFAGANS